MKIIQAKTALTCFVIATLSACTSIPEQRAAVESAQTLYKQVQANPDVLKHPEAARLVRSAESDISDAHDAMDPMRLAEMSVDFASTQDYAAIAERKLRLAQAMVDNEQSAEQLAKLESEHEKVFAAFEIRQQQEAEAARLAEEQARIAAEKAAAEQEREERVKQLQAILRQAQEQGVKVKEEGTQLSIQFPGVTFDTNKTKIKADFKDDLLSVAKSLLETYPDASLQIHGHTDSTGSKQYNEKLSQNRANSVKVFLIDNGVSPGRMVSKGFGLEKPVASNDTPKGRAQNRRVELVIMKQPNEQ